MDCSCDWVMLIRKELTSIHPHYIPVCDYWTWNSWRTFLYSFLSSLISIDYVWHETSFGLLSSFLWDSLKYIIDIDMQETILGVVSIDTIFVLWLVLYRKSTLEIKLHWHTWVQECQNILNTNKEDISVHLKIRFRKSIPQ